MNRLLDAIGRFIGLIPDWVNTEIRGLWNSVLWLIAILLAMPLFKFIINDYAVSLIICTILWLLSLFVVYNTRRIVFFATAGEGAKISHLTPAKQVNQGSQSIIANPLNTAFWKGSLQVVFLVTTWSLATPLIPFRENWFFLLSFPAVVIGLAIGFKRTALRIANWTSSAFLVVLLGFHVFQFFPEVRAAIGLNRFNIGPDSSTATLLNNGEETIKRRKIGLVNIDVAAVLKKGIEHPQKPLTPVEKAFLAQARKGGLKTLAEVAAEKTTATMASTLIDTVHIDQSGYPRDLSGYLPAGDYEIKFQPAEAAAGAALQVLLPDGKYILRKIENNSVSVKGGEKGCGIKALSPAIARIYA